MSKRKDAVTRACAAVMKPASRSKRMREAAPEMYELLETVIESTTKALELGDVGDWHNAEIWINNLRGNAETLLARIDESEV